MSRRGKWFARVWCQRGIAAHLLWPVSMLYGAISGLHRWLYRVRIFKTERCRVPVIVVGNVVAGGAGKTPLVIVLAKHLRQQGLQVGIVSRGYGRQSKNCIEVLASTPISASGDEPALIFRALAAPIFVANRRIDAIEALLAAYPTTQVIISDDGLQHYGLARDIDITVFDDRGIGNGWLLPAGPLREPFKPSQPKRGLRYRSVNGLVLHTGQLPAFDGFVSTRRLADCAVAPDGRQIPLDDLKHQQLAALAAIANPDAFFDMLKARGLQLAHTISLPDHFDFSNYTLPVLGIATVLCTEKDAVKLFKLPMRTGLQVLEVPLEFAPEPAFLKAVSQLLAPLLYDPSLTKLNQPMKA